MPSFGRLSGSAGRLAVRAALRVDRSERKHGLSTEQFSVSAYAGSSKDLKDLKHLKDLKGIVPLVVSTAFCDAGVLIKFLSPPSLPDPTQEEFLRVNKVATPFERGTPVVHILHLAGIECGACACTSQTHRVSF